MKDHEGRDFCLVSLVLALVSTKICIWTLTEWISNFGLGPPHLWYGVKESLLRFFSLTLNPTVQARKSFPFSVFLVTSSTDSVSFSLFLVATTIILFWGYSTTPPPHPSLNLTPELNILSLHLSFFLDSKFKESFCLKDFITNHFGEIEKEYKTRSIYKGLGSLTVIWIPCRKSG